MRTITDKIRRGTDMEAILRIGLQELSQMLGAPEMVVRLGTQEQFSPPFDKSILGVACPEPRRGVEGLRINLTKDCSPAGNWQRVKQRGFGDSGLFDGLTYRLR